MAAGFVTISATAVLASIGLEALGLGPQYLPTLGMTIYWAISFSALDSPTEGQTFPRALKYFL